MIMEGSFRPRFFTPREVAVHNRPWDLWVSYLGRVYDLSPLSEEYRGKGGGRGRSFGGKAPPKRSLQVERQST